MEASLGCSSESQKNCLEPRNSDVTLLAINLLSPDCRGHVFRFLGLFDCLRFAETSKASLEQVIKEVERRRRNQFLDRPYEEFLPSDYNELDLPFSRRQSAQSHERNKNSDSKTRENEKTNPHPFLSSPAAQRGETRRSFYNLPSVLERIEGLYRAIPGTHPFNDDLRNLVADLKKDTIIVTNSDRNQTSNVMHANLLLQRFASVTYAHRLHASLLSRCTISLNPVPYHDRGGYDDTSSFTVTLERYMGDVLSARCLMGHSYRCLEEGFSLLRETFHTMRVEGGPSFRRWIDHLPASTHVSDSNLDQMVSVRHWYKYWVFFHSALLRIAPFSIEQAEKLKLGPLSGILEPLDLYCDTKTQTGRDNTINSDSTNRNNRDANTNNAGGQRKYRRWFVPSKKYACCSIQDMNALQERMNQLFHPNHRRITHIGNLETTLHHFGPLGRFRGRDRVATETMSPNKIYESFLLCLENRSKRTYTSKLVHWLDGLDDHGMLRWMIFVQDESRRIRPMTVQPPLVTIRMITHIGELP